MIDSVLNMRLAIKVLVTCSVFALGAPAKAFNVLVCNGTIDVRLIGPSTKKTRSVKSFSITRKEALELDLLVDGVDLGHLFPWDHVVWEPVKSISGFKDLKMKTDDETTIAISVFDVAHKKAHSFECHFRFE